MGGGYPSKIPAGPPSIQHTSLLASPGAAPHPAAPPRRRCPPALLLLAALLAAALAEGSGAPQATKLKYAVLLSGGSSVEDSRTVGVPLDQTVPWGSYHITLTDYQELADMHAMAAAAAAALKRASKVGGKGQDLPL